MKKILDSILLSKNAMQRFYEYYNEKDFKDWILSLLSEVEQCKNLKQDNPWHIFNCLDHILKSVEYMNKQTVNLNYKERKMLAYVMFLHDIGKPECYLRRYSKLYGREVDSFFNHNQASVKIADRVLPNLGFDNEEIKKMKLLIDEHDVFMFLTLEDDGNKYHTVLTPSVVKEMIVKFSQVGDGVQLLKYLIMVGKSDNLAQNPQRTGQSFVLLNKMQKILNKFEIKI